MRLTYHSKIQRKIVSSNYFCNSATWQSFYTLLSSFIILCYPSQCKEIEENNRVGKNAAAAKLLQSCLTLCDPINDSPTGSSVPGILQARILEWVAISFSNAWKWKVKVKSLSHVRLFTTPWTAAYQAPPSMGFSRQEYWSGVPLISLMIILVLVFSKSSLFLKWNTFARILVKSHTCITVGFCMYFFFKFSKCRKI